MIKWFKIFDNLEKAEDFVGVNESQLIVAKGRRICLARTKEGFKAIDDTCPHLGDSLSNGHLNHQNEVTCPWHSYRFNLDDGHECANRAPDVVVHHIKHNDEGFYLGIETE